MKCKNKHLCDCFGHCGNFQQTEDFYKHHEKTQPKPKHTVKLSEEAKERVRSIAPSQFK